MAEKPVHNKFMILPASTTSWGWSRLSDVCSGIFDCPHSTPELTDQGPLLARSQDIRLGFFDIGNAARVSETTYIERTARAEPEFGDLLYSREGTYFGIAAEMPQNRRVCLGQRMVLIRPDRRRINSRFLKYWLNSPGLARYLNGYYEGSVAQRLNLPTIRGLPVPFLPLAEQEAIAGCLGALDDKIELNRQMNQTLESLAQAIFRSWFVDFDPIVAKAGGRKPFGMTTEIAALFPERFVNSEIGPIPEGWNSSFLVNDFGITMGQSPPGSTYNRAGLGIPFYQGRSDFGYRFPTARVYCTAPSRFAEPGDVLISVRAPVGDINVAHERCAIGRGLSAIRARNRSYCLYCINDLRPEFSVFEGEGTLFGSMSKDDLGRIPIVRPPEELVQLFERVAGPIDDSILSNWLESRTLAELRDLLLPKLLSGEIRLRQAEKAVEQAL
jgi:type I restriction enzyme, S subunit